MPNFAACADECEAHPTQKPVAVMAWLLDKERQGLVVDPFMGVGSTLVAAERMGREGFGVEVRTDFFEIACRRVEAAAAQPRLDFAAAPKPEQLMLQEEQT